VPDLIWIKSGGLGSPVFAEAPIDAGRTTVSELDGGCRVVSITFQIASIVRVIAGCVGFLTLIQSFDPAAL
jgi:hypothetical protein